MPHPARTTTLLLNIFGLQATPMRGANPHCLPVRVESLTPGVAWGLFPATIKPVDVMVPQMFCLPGMTSYRALFDQLDIPYVGNPPDVMALAAHKARAVPDFDAQSVKLRFRVRDHVLIRIGLDHVGNAHDMVIRR